jgi:hypothetical protein
MPAPARSSLPFLADRRSSLTAGDTCRVYYTPCNKLNMHKYITPGMRELRIYTGVPGKGKETRTLGRDRRDPSGHDPPPIGRVRVPSRPLPPLPHLAPSTKLLFPQILPLFGLYVAYKRNMVTINHCIKSSTVMPFTATGNPANIPLVALCRRFHSGFRPLGRRTAPACPAT